MKNRISFWKIILLVPLLFSCNIYRPFQGGSDVNDYLEEARLCLHNGDFACADTNYNKLPDGELKTQKLCMLSLARAGLGLKNLINTFNKGDKKMVGQLANTLIPWSEAKAQFAADAVKHCVDYATMTGGDIGVLLKTAAYIVDCSMRIAKVDQFVATSDTDSTCTTAGNNDGTVTASEIADGANGAISARGMCGSDVIACQTDIVGLDSASLASAGLDELKSAYDQIPAALRTSGAATALTRSAIKDIVP